jgi:beta-N-acetylhexosaminidase
MNPTPLGQLPLGQLFVIGFDGHTVPAVTKELLAKERMGGAILFSRNIESLEQVVALNAELFELGDDDAPTLISVDQEGGRVARLRGICTDLPPMRRVGELSFDDYDLPYRVGAMMARELGALGFHMDYAPVLDVDTNPDNPVIGDRSFGRDAHRVANIGVQLIRGMQQAGVAASAKHFPGHGDTLTDSHFELPRLPHEIQRLEEVELIPFRAAIDVGVASIMTAHVVFEALDDSAPATLSRTVMTELLRERMAYDGVVVSDDLEMKAVADRYEIEELVRLGLLAGVDQFLICHDADKQEKALRAVHHLVDTGEVPRERVEEALARIRRLKQRFIGAPTAPTLTEAQTIVRSAPHLSLAERLGAASDDAPERLTPVDHM